MLSVGSFTDYGGKNLANIWNTSQVMYPQVLGPFCLLSFHFAFVLHVDFIRLYATFLYALFD